MIIILIDTFSLFSGDGIPMEKNDESFGGPHKEDKKNS